MNDYFDRIEQQIARRVQAGAPPRSRWRPPIRVLAPALSLTVVVAVAIVFLSVRKSGPPVSSGGGTGVELVYQAEPTVQSPVVTRASLARTIEVMRRRAAAVGVSGGSYRASGSDQITVRLPAGNNVARATKILGVPAQLEFYDWEANALTPSGQTVASQLRGQDPKSLEISQGAGRAAPGQPGAGGMRLYDAVKLASRQPAEVSPDNSRAGTQYFLFASPGSAACNAAARAQSKSPAADTHCLLSGPAANPQQLATALPTGVTAAQAQDLAIKPGTVVLQAASPNAKSQTSLYDPNARFYVLKDHVALSGAAITSPRQSTDASGLPDVAFGFTSDGKQAFQKVTREVAHRGQVSSLSNQQLNQHFAVALDNQLLTVPSIDYRAYPNGIPGNAGADITAALTIQSARDLATQLRLGALPLNLRLIDEQPLRTIRP